MSKAVRMIGIGILLVVTGGLAGIPAALGTALTAIGVNQILGGVAFALAGKPTNKTYNPVRLNAIGGVEILNIVFGEMRIGGTLACKAVAGTDNKYLYLAVVHSVAQDCGNQSAEDFYIDEKEVGALDGGGEVTAGDYTGLLNVKHYLGTDAQTVDGVLTAALGTDWPSTAVLRGCQYTRVRALHQTDQTAHSKAFPRGEPTVSALVRGWKCYDPRLDSTNGGSGSHRYTDDSTWEWTRNPALIWAQYKIAPAKHGGWGYDPATRINWASVAAAATINDDTVDVPGGTQTRYTFDGWLWTGDALEDNEQKILTSMAGWSAEVGGVATVYAGEYVTPTETITEDYVDGPVDELMWTPREQTYNRVDGTYLDRDVGWKMIQAWSATDAGYVTDDGQAFPPRQVQHHGCTNRYHAQRLSIVCLKDSRNQRIVKFPTSPLGMNLEPGKFYALDLDLRGTQITGNFLMTGWGTARRGGPAEFKEYDPDTFTVEEADYQTIDPDATIDDAFRVPFTPVNLTAEGGVNQFRLRVDPPAPYLDWTIWEVSSTGGGSGFAEFARGQGLIGTGYGIFDDITTRYFRCKFANKDRPEIEGAYSSEASATTVGDLTVADSGAQLGGAENGLQVNFGNVGGRLNIQPLTAADVGSDVTISIAAFTITCGDLGAVSVNAGTITGQPFSTELRIYYDDPDFLGGTVTFHATTSKTVPSANDGRVWIGTITTPANGGGGTGGGGGGGTECVAVDSWLQTDKGPRRAGDVLPGEIVYTSDGWRALEYAGETVEADCVTLVVADGSELTLSADTPITMADSRSVAAKDCLGEGMHVTGRGWPTWQLVAEVKDVGRAPVRRLSFGGRSFAAGDAPGRYLFSHNTEKP